MIILKFKSHSELTRALETDPYIQKATDRIVDWTKNTIYLSYGKETDKVQDALAVEVIEGYVQ